MESKNNIHIIKSDKETLPPEVEELISLNPKELETWKNRVLYIVKNTPNYDMDALVNFCFLAQLKIHNQNKFTYLVCKRIFDFTIAILALAFLSPLFLALGIYIKYQTKGSIFFRQLRIGQYGIPFYIYKFRTIKMEFENIYPIPMDAIIPGGLFFRNFKLDELPQLINILKGEMALVGPRPLIIEESAVSAKKHKLRFAAAPGLTGLWQIHTPRAEDIKIKTHLDTRYIKQRTFWLDLILIAKTIPILIIKNKNKKHNKKQYTNKSDIKKDAA